MLFNSHIFVFAFLPIVLAGHILLGRLRSAAPARLWLLAASLVFYGWWSWTYLGLLVASLLLNYGFGIAIRSATPGRSRALMLTGVGLNLLLLVWYKYASFLAANATALFGLEYAMDAYVLPLAISFYTFLQVAFLVDTWRGRSRHYGFLEYALFVTFFPHLIAGPIVHHHELIPQFRRRSTFAFQPAMAAGGMALFVIGLLKKLLIADPVGDLASPIFASAEAVPPGMLEAWIATIAFATGLYLDFSAYSDMAIGLARLFGVQFPYNFNSPYKARSIVDFWHRWHMTLSRFLRDYVYVPLGGNRHGSGRRYANLVITMLLGGLWHGAGWTFVIWGGLHGMFLLLNHAWNAACAAGRAKRLGFLPAWGLTMAAVLLAWVFFAAPTLAAAMSVLGGMLGLNGFMWPEAGILAGKLAQGQIAEVVRSVPPKTLASACTLALALVLVLGAPNSQQIVDGRSAETTEPRKWGWLRFRPSPAMGAMTAMAFLLAVAFMANIKEFVYFQF
ncbi:MBOAT family protein [Roseomonas sp. NAR14]|uniref:Probable alginate O-acetylase AlgI n=1 Tax=Roseomonas acroporae TaxID=2937791 RepID=A0A9X2BY78_9PROT|nr:MBOAT family O-acyltransferase [Roseomonas acroporae]MCK8786704.1 MBOAT family protein [Roseomonas acroporae]